jgi:hypothetical protein
LISHPQFQVLLAGNRLPVVIVETQLLPCLRKTVETDDLPLADDCATDHSLTLQVHNE